MSLGGQDLSNQVTKQQVFAAQKLQANMLEKHLFCNILKYTGEIGLDICRYQFAFFEHNKGDERPKPEHDN